MGQERDPAKGSLAALLELDATRKDLLQKKLYEYVACKECLIRSQLESRINGSQCIISGTPFNYYLRQNGRDINEGMPLATVKAAYYLAKALNLEIIEG